VFAVTAMRRQVFKRYLPSTLESDPALERRLRVMVEHRPEGWREGGSGHLTLAWPTEVVLADGRFTGFLMPVVDMKDTVGLHRITNPTDRRMATGTTAWIRGFTWRYLIRTGVNLAHATHTLHKAGVVIGDFNESNIRAWRQARITLIDCDSMQIRDPASGERFFCPVGRPEFTPPELLNADWRRTVRHPSGDLFALAIHVYQLLLEGEHPFRGLWHGTGDKPPVSQLAREGIWAQRGEGPLTPRPAAIGSRLLTDDIVRLFRRAFEDGAISPTARPTAAEWLDALTGLDRQLRRCTADRSHFYPDSQGACPWCGHKQPAPRPVVPRTTAPATPHPTLPSAPVPSATVRAPSPALVAATARRARRARQALIALGVVAVLALTGLITGLALTGVPPRSPDYTLTDVTGIAGTTGDVTGVAYSPDGRTLATADGDGRTYLWNAARRSVTATLADPDSTGVTAVAFDSDGAMLAAADGDGRTYLWNLATRKVTATVSAPDSTAANAVAFSPDGRLLATADSNGSAYLWNVANGRLIRTLTDPTAYSVAAVAFSPDGKTLATGDADVYLWDVATGRLRADLPEPTDPDALAYSPDGQTLAVGDVDGGIELWRTATDEQTRTFGSLSDYGIGALAFSPDGKTLAAADGAQDTYLLNMATGKNIATVTDPEEVSWAEGKVTGVAFSPDGKTLVASDANGSTYLWLTKWFKS